MLAEENIGEFGESMAIHQSFLPQIIQTAEFTNVFPPYGIMIYVCFKFSQLINNFVLLSLAFVCLYRKFHLPISIQDLNKKQKYLDTYTVRSTLYRVTAILILSTSCDSIYTRSTEKAFNQTTLIPPLSHTTMVHIILTVE